MKLQRTRTWIGNATDTPVPEQRKAERGPCSVSAYLFDAAGISSSATILDLSKAGVRVTCAEPSFHQKACYILRLDTGAGYVLRRAWYANEVAGYEFKRRLDGSRRSSNRAIKMIHVTWAEYEASQASEGHS